MGCYNSSGFISKIPIRYGDRVVCFIGLVNQKVTGRGMFTPDGLVSPLFLPVRGIYDDYGSVTDIDRTLVVDLLERHSGMDIEALLKTVERCIYGNTVKDNMEYWKNYEDEREEYGKLQAFLEKLQDDFWNKRRDYTPVLMMEHEAVYDRITRDFPPAGRWFSENAPENYLNRFRQAVKKVGRVCESLKDATGTVVDCRFVPGPFDTFTWALCHASSLPMDRLDETDARNLKEAWKELSEIDGLMSSECIASTMGFFDALSAEERLAVYDTLNEEFERFYKLWVSFCRAPMYFGFSQTDGMQEYDYGIVENVYEACLDRLRELKRKDREESE